MDGVWLPAGGENPRARGLPDSRHKPGPGIAKGEAFSPLVRPRQRQVGKSPQPTRAEPDQAATRIRTKYPITNHAENGGLRSTQPTLPDGRTHRTQLLPVSITPKLEAVCRAGRRGGCSRCAVRMTAKGSVTPWMACGSRPVKDDPEPGAFPAAGTRSGPGLSRGRPFPP